MLWKTFTAKNEDKQDHRNPYYDEKGGAYTHTGSNNIKITIPATKDGTTYTNSTLLSAINEVFNLKIFFIQFDFRCKWR